MAAYDITIKIETLRTGQPRAYADHERVERVTILSEDWDGNLTPMNEDIAEQYVDKLCRFRQDGTKIPMKRGIDWATAFDTYLKKIEKVGESVWEATYITPFTD